MQWVNSICKAATHKMIWIVPTAKISETDCGEKIKKKALDYRIAY